MDPALSTPTPATGHDTTVIGAAIITPATQEERREEDASHAISEGRVTPPVINDAIAEIENFEFNPSLGEYTSAADRERIEEEAIATALIMFSPTAAVELPKLRTDTWHYGEKEPNPISIGTARKLLATAYAEIPCELEAAGDHGYAWIIEPEATWTARGGVQPISAPTKPKEVTGFDMRAQWEYSVKSKRYTMYKHLAQEGRTKIMEWFGKAMFHDLFKNDALPPTVTPSDLLAHIEATYATPSANRICMEEVEDKINGRYDTKQAVEAYFMQLQDARTHAKLLGVSYTDQQIMNKALKQFELRYEKDAYKAEKKWNERDAKAKTWSHFKKYWKEEVHQWNVYAARSKKKQAHHAVDVESIMENVSALRAEAVSLKEYNANLTEQLNFHNAMQAERSSSGNHNAREDDISTITNHLEGWLGKKLANITVPTTPSSITTREERLHTATNRSPRDFRTYNDGKGKRFTSYCWKCGCNCTHWTKRCLELSGNDRKKYRDADFDNRMGGSTKYLERQGKYQKDYDFDSL